MAEISRVQIAVCGALAVALLLLGARSIRNEGDPQYGASPAASPAPFQLRDSAGDVVVHVAGAVRSPGVYRLPAGTRVTDAVQRAGGATSESALHAVNLAARLSDGQQVVIPEVGPGGGAAAVAVTENGPISLGTATVEQLNTVEGIGPVTAQDIVQFRDQHGGLSSVEQLNEISGIGPATMDGLRGRLQP